MFRHYANSGPSGARTSTPIATRLSGFGLQPPPSALYLDLRLVTFVDSSGIGALVAAHGLTVRAGSRLVLENPSGTLLRTLRTAGLVTLFGLPPA